MKQLFTTRVFLALFVITVFNACDQAPKTIEIETTNTSTSSKEVLAENKSAVNMKIEGMVCAMGCAKFIEDKVAAMDGVVQSKVNYEAGTANFEFDQTVLSAKDIESFINEIHDGQYKAEISEVPTEAKEEVKSEGKSKEKELDPKKLNAVSEKLNFSFPELFTYFLKRL